MKSSDNERDAIEATAAEWLARRDRGFMAEEAVMFARWQMADPRHREAVVELELAWEALDELSSENLASVSQQRAGGIGVMATPVPPAPITAASEALRVGDGSRGKRGGLAAWWPALGMAAVLALVAGGLFWRGVFDRAEPTLRYETLVGMQETIELSDGSELRLNTNTAVLVEFSRKVRQVTLERGEAFFGVAKDAKRPFVVRARDAEARVVGTAFAVRLREPSRETEVLVAEGRVSFGRGGTMSVNPTLEAGQRGVLGWEHARLLQITALGADEISRRLSWQVGRLDFKDTPLAEAVMEINRYQRQQVILKGAGLADARLGGVFKLGNVGSFVRLVEAAFPVVVEHQDGDKIVLVPRT